MTTNIENKIPVAFTKRLANISNTNSMNCAEIDNANHAALCLNDFIGGPIEEHLINLMKQNIQSVELNRSITSTPADSSGGYHNTFSVLEKHLNKNKYQRLNQKQIEYLLLLNKDSNVNNHSYIDIPIEDHQILQSVNNLTNSSMNDSSAWIDNDDVFSSHLELKLEALDKLRSMWGDNALESVNIQNANEGISPLPSDSSSVETCHQQDNTEAVRNSNEYIYHVAKTRTGQIYIRVRSNLQLDRGKTLMN